jgi:hypothetical protein
MESRRQSARREPGWRVAAKGGTETATRFLPTISGGRSWEAGDSDGPPPFWAGGTWRPSVQLFFLVPILV